MMKPSEDSNPAILPFRKALEWIVFSTLLVSGTCALSVFYFHYVKESYAKDDRYTIVAVAQTCKDPECLKTNYLAELLELSVDKPSNLYRFKIRDAKKRLLDSLIIKNVEIKKIKPGTISVDYTLRIPVAYIAEFTNTAIDEEGVLIPFKPFFTPKNIPEFVLGLTDEESSDPTTIQWGIRLNGRKSRLAFAILQLMQEKFGKGGMQLQRIDVSKAFAPSYGQREIVVVVEDREEKNIDGQPYLYTYPRTIRLSTQQYGQELANYSFLREHLNRAGQLTDSLSKATVWKAPALVIDMRIPQLAFISKIE